LTINYDVPASLSIRTATGSEAFLLKNSSSASSNVAGEAAAAWFTTNFLLQAVSTTRNEKFQEIETFGPTYGFFFGERPIMINAQAVLLSTPDFPWVVEWWWNYAHGLSGTKLTEANSRVYLEYNDMILEGYILNCQVTETADNPNSVNMSFSMWVTQVDYKIDAGKPYSQARSYLDVGEGQDGDVQVYDGEGAGVSVTGRAVRTANVVKIIKTGSISSARYLPGDTRILTGEVGRLTELASLFLYGRQIVIPEGYLGSEVYSGAAEFATGTASEALLRQLGAVSRVSFTQVRLPPKFTVNDRADANRRSRPFYENTDEYPYAPPPSTATAKNINLKVAKVSSVFRVERGSGITFNGIYLDDPTKLAGGLDMFAQQAFRTNRIGKLYPKITNAEGGVIPEWAIKLGRVAYGGVLLAGSGLTQLASSTTTPQYGLSAAPPNSEGSSTVDLQREAVPPLVLNQSVTGDLTPSSVTTTG
jgi:hypothetical protein